MTDARMLGTHPIPNDIPFTLFYSNAAIIAVISLNYWLITQHFCAAKASDLWFNLYVNAFVPCVLFCQHIICWNEMWDVWFGGMLITTQMVELQRISPISLNWNKIFGGIKGTFLFWFLALTWNRMGLYLFPHC